MQGSFDVGLCGSLCVAGMLFDVCWLELTVRVWVVLLGLGEGRGDGAARSCTWGVSALMIDLELYESLNNFLCF
jgi:hypothetical protein